MQAVTVPACSKDQTHIWADVLAQAVTGELIGALNYTTLAELYEDAAEKAEALEHAQGERGHAASFTEAGRALGIEESAAIVTGFYRPNLQLATTPVSAAAPRCTARWIYISAF